MQQGSKVETPRLKAWRYFAFVAQVYQSLRIQSVSGVHAFFHAHTPAPLTNLFRKLFEYLINDLIFHYRNQNSEGGYYKKNRIIIPREKQSPTNRALGLSA
jgi:hypothetical protein